MSSNGVKYDGDKFFLNGKDYIVPALSVRQAKKLWPKIIQLNEGINLNNVTQKYDIALEVIHAAMTRNYPDLKLSQLSDMIDLRNMRSIILSISGQSGILSKGSGPAVDNTAATQSTGTISTE